MCFTLYTQFDLGSTEKWRWWARAVRRHQRRLMARLLAELNGPEPPVELAPEHLPWTLEDLARLRRPTAQCSSRYYGVTKIPVKGPRRGYFAYRPRDAHHGRKRLGWYATEDEAGWSVIKALNPNAVIPTTPTEGPA